MVPECPARCRVRMSRYSASSFTSRPGGRLAVGGEVLDIGKEDGEAPELAAEGGLAPGGEQAAHEVAGHVLDEGAQAGLHAVGGVAELVDLAGQGARHGAGGELEVPDPGEVVAEQPQRLADAVAHEDAGEHAGGQRGQRDADHAAGDPVAVPEDRGPRRHARDHAMQAGGRVDVDEGGQVRRRADLNRHEMAGVLAVDVLEPADWP